MAEMAETAEMVEPVEGRRFRTAHAQTLEGGCDYTALGWRGQEQ